MDITLSVIKADIGSIGGHIAPSQKLLSTVRDHVKKSGEGLIRDHYISFTGDDIAIVMTHTRGAGDEAVHKLAWDAFIAGTATAKQQGFFGAAMLPMSELEYTEIMEKLARLEERFVVRD